MRKTVKNILRLKRIEKGKNEKEQEREIQNSLKILVAKHKALDKEDSQLLS